MICLIDKIAIGKDELSYKIAFDCLIELIEALGLDVNWSKVSQPVRKLTFLGVVIDCTNRTFSLPQSKVSELKILRVKSMKCCKMLKFESQHLT